MQYMIILKNEEMTIMEIPKEEYELYKYFTKEELEETAEELAYMEKHLKEYPKYNNREDLKKVLLSDDEI